MSYDHVRTISMYLLMALNWTLRGLGFKPHYFTNSVTLGKSLNFYGPDFFICENREQTNLHYTNFQVPLNSKFP